MDGWMEGWIHKNGWMDLGWMDGWMDGWVYRCMDGWMDGLQQNYLYLTVYFEIAFMV